MNDLDKINIRKNRNINSSYKPAPIDKIKLLKLLIFTP